MNSEWPTGNQSKAELKIKFGGKRLSVKNGARNVTKAQSTNL